MFLKLTKKHHLDKALRIKFTEDPVTCNVETKTYEDNSYNVFTLKVKNIGGKFFTEDEGSFSINNGTAFDFKISESLYKQLSNYKKNNAVEVKMKKVEDPKNRAGFVWDVKPLAHDQVQNDVVSSSNDLKIKWGMAFNNATRLVSNIKITDSVLSIEDKVKMIEEIMPDMFRIACGMPEEPKKEEEKHEDDLPF